MRSKPFVFKNPNSKFWKLRFYDNGKPKTITTGVEYEPKKEKESKDKADAWAENFLKDPEQKEKLKEPIKFSTLINDKFLPDNTLSDGSIRNYKSIITILNSIIPEKFVHQYTKDDINNFINNRKKVSEHTLKNNVTYLTSIFNYAVAENYIKSNPVHKAKSIKPKKTKIVYFSDEHFEILVETITEQIVRDLVYFAVYTGLRASEILNLKLDYVYLKPRIILNYQSKVNDFNSISIADDILDIVERNYNLNKELKQEYLFTYVNQKTKQRSKITVNWLSDNVKKTIRSAELPEHYCFKTLRKTFGSKLWQSNVDLAKVSHLLGHADSRITKEHYAQLGKGYDPTVNLIGLKGKKK